MEVPPGAAEGICQIARNPRDILPRTPGARLLPRNLHTFILLNTLSTQADFRGDGARPGAWARCHLHGWARETTAVSTQGLSLTSWMQYLDFSKNHPFKPQTKAEAHPHVQSHLLLLSRSTHRAAAPPTGPGRNPKPCLLVRSPGWRASAFRGRRRGQDPSPGARAAGNKPRGGDVWSPFARQEKGGCQRSDSEPPPLAPWGQGRLPGVSYPSPGICLGWSIARNQEQEDNSPAHPAWSFPGYKRGSWELLPALASSTLIHGGCSHKPALPLLAECARCMGWDRKRS